MLAQFGLIILLLTGMPAFAQDSVDTTDETTSLQIQPKDGLHESAPQNIVIRFSTDPGEPVSSLIQKVAAASFTTDERFYSALASLRDLPQGIRTKIAETLSREYFALSTEKSNERWFLVWLLSEMKFADQPQVLKTFQAILDQKITIPHEWPPEGTSPFDEEIKIYLTAVDGLWRLAWAGDRTAAPILLKNVIHPEYAVRRAAVMAYLNLPADKESAKKDIQKYLRPEEAFFLNLKWLREPPVNPEASSSTAQNPAPRPSQDNDPPPSVSGGGSSPR